MCIFWIIALPDEKRNSWQVREELHYCTGVWSQQQGKLPASGAVKAFTYYKPLNLRQHII